MDITTKILHTPFSKADAHGSLRMPVYDSAAFEFANSNDLELAFSGRLPAHMYSRISNPTVEYFEKQLNSITGAFSTIAVSSGMAAISTVLLSVLQAGDNVVTSRFLFGNTFSLLSQTLQSFNIDCRFADITNEEELIKAIDKNTRVIFFETITNPQLEVANIDALAKVAKAHNILLIADTTLSPPNVFNAKQAGINIEVISSTKFISGGATSVGGAIIDNGTFDWKHIPKLSVENKKFGPGALTYKLRKELFRNLGGCLSPHNAYLQSLGLETLDLRLRRASTNTKTLASWLERHPKIKEINFPLLPSNPYYNNTVQQFDNYGGTLLTIQLEDKASCYRFIDNIKLARRATNIQDNKTLIIHPSSTLFNEYSTDIKQELKVYENLIRISVGIEEINDLIDDFKQALERDEFIDYRL